MLCPVLLARRAELVHVGHCRCLLTATPESRAHSPCGNLKETFLSPPYWAGPFKPGRLALLSEPLKITGCLQTAALLQTVTRKGKQALGFEAAAKKKLLLPSLSQQEVRLRQSPSGRSENQQ